MLPSSKSKNTLFTYNFYQPVIDKKFFNSNPNNLVFSSGLFGGCLFSSNNSVSVLREWDNIGTPTSDIFAAAAEIGEALEVDAMEENTEHTPEEGAVVGLPKAKLKLMDVFSSYLTFLRKSFLQVTGRKRAKVITWSKGKPTVKQVDQTVEDEAPDEIVVYGEYMPFDTSETVEETIFGDIVFPCLYPHVYSAFENRDIVRNNRHLFDDGATNALIPEQVRSVEGYKESLGNLFESKTGELATQFPCVISAFETYRNLCYESLKETYMTVECEDDSDLEIEGSVSYATAGLSSDVFRDGFLQLEDERFDDQDSLDALSYKSFGDNQDEGICVLTSSSSDSVQKADVGEEMVMFRGFHEGAPEILNGGDGKPWDGLGLAKDPIDQFLQQQGDIVGDRFHDYITNDVPNVVENEIFHDVKHADAKTANQLPKVMLKWLGHFWGLEEELGPSIENVSKFQHVFTPLKVAPTR